LSNQRLTAACFIVCFVSVLFYGNFGERGIQAYAYDNDTIESIEALKELNFDTSCAAEKQSVSVVEKKRLDTNRPQDEALFYPLIRKAARRHDIDAALIMAIVYAESRYNPKATSKRGARGLMQLMPETAKALGVKNSFNPEQNINGGVKYFKKLVNKTDGNIELALAAYNAGYQNIRRYKGVPPFKATQSFIKKVLKHYRFYKNVSRNMS